jgi:hypothetical protein
MWTNMARRVAKALVWVAVVAVVSGCATCQPATIIVAQKDQTVRFDPRPGPIRTTETGRIEEAVRPTLIGEYWVRTREGRWRQVSHDQFQSAEIGAPLQVCE